MTAPTGTVYFIQRTTLSPKPTPAATIAPPLSPRSRRVRAEKKAGKKKGRRT
jgi:hypothetical protein